MNNTRTLDALLLSSILVLFPFSAYAEPPPPKSVQASATEEVTIEATLVRASIAVVITASTAGEASKKAAEKASAVLEWLKTAKVSKLKTQGLSLSPQYNYNNGTNKIVGYQATHSMSFELPVDRAGEVLDDVIDKGASRIDYITFSATDAESDAARLRAIEKATLSAKTQAEQALKAVGLPARNISEILVNAESRYGPFPMPQSRMFRGAGMEVAAAGAPATPVEGGELTVSASVTVRIEF